LAAATTLGACSQQTSPQQQFVEALNRGQGAQAAQIYQSMSSEDRNRLRRGDGLQVKVSDSQVQSAIHMHAASGDEGGASENLPSNGLGDALRALSTGVENSPPTTTGEP
jgi:hypothetical protein